MSQSGTRADCWLLLRLSLNRDTTILNAEDFNIFAMLMDEHTFQILGWVVAAVMAFASAMLFNRLNRMERDVAQIWQKINSIDSSTVQKFESVHKDISDTRIEFTKQFGELKLFIQQQIAK